MKRLFSARTFAAAALALGAVLLGLAPNGFFAFLQIGRSAAMVGPP